MNKIKWTSTFQFRIELKQFKWTDLQRGSLWQWLSCNVWKHSELTLLSSPQTTHFWSGNIIKYWLYHLSIIDSLKRFLETTDMLHDTVTSDTEHASIRLGTLSDHLMAGAEWWYQYWKHLHKHNTLHAINTNIKRIRVAPNELTPSKKFSY